MAWIFGFFLLICYLMQWQISELNKQSKLLLEIINNDREECQLERSKAVNNEK